MKSFFSDIKCGRIQIHDLSQPISCESPTWDGQCGFNHVNVLNYGQDLFRVQQFQLNAGIGTHIDAPAHLFEGKQTVADIPLSDLFFPLSIIDIREKVKRNRSYSLSVDDVELYEQRFGQMPSNTLLIAHTGWGSYWNSPDTYRSANSENIMTFPSIHKSIAEKYQSRICGLGIDTLSPDCGDDFPVHHIMLGAGKLIVENISDRIENVPPSGAYGICVPLKLKDGTESPVRLLAFSE